MCGRHYRTYQDAWLCTEVHHRYVFHPETIMPKPLTECPCGGKLRVIEKREYTYELDGACVYDDVEVFLWCVDCDDWGEASTPDGVTYGQIQATIDRFQGVKS
jgi:hypothetical protein